MKKLKDIKNEVLSTPIDTTLIINLLRRERLTLKQISERLLLPEYRVMAEIEKLASENYMIKSDGECFFVSESKQGNKVKLNANMWDGDTIRLGLCSDNHLCSHYERLDVLNLLYDIYEKEGIKTVLNAGNWIDGEAKFNKNEIHTAGFENQIKYAVEHYPFRKGMETWFISGDDHEGWYNQKVGINSGDQFQNRRERAGMFDLKHLGYVEADINLNDDKYENPMWIRVMHPGGGSSYAVSYAPQKIVESLQGGEKPNILIVGHYHKMSYNVIRGVHVVQPGCTEDQSVFMRKLKIEAHVGGAIMNITRNSEGVLSRCSVEFITVFDKKFYAGKDKYWKKN